MCLVTVCKSILSFSSFWYFLRHVRPCACSEYGNKKQINPRRTGCLNQWSVNVDANVSGQGGPVPPPRKRMRHVQKRDPRRERYERVLQRHGITGNQCAAGRPSIFACPSTPPVGIVAVFAASLINQSTHAVNRRASPLLPLIAVVHPLVQSTHQTSKHPSTPNQIHPSQVIHSFVLATSHLSASC